MAVQAHFLKKSVRNQASQGQVSKKPKEKLNTQQKCRIVDQNNSRKVVGTVRVVRWVAPTSNTRLSIPLSPAYNIFLMLGSLILARPLYSLVWPPSYVHVFVC